MEGSQNVLLSYSKDYFMEQNVDINSYQTLDTRESSNLSKLSPSNQQQQQNTQQQHNFSNVSPLKNIGHSFDLNKNQYTPVGPIKKKSMSVHIQRKSIDNNDNIRPNKRKHRIRNSFQKTSGQDNIVKIEKEKTQGDINFLEELLEHHFLFSRFEYEDIEKLAQEFYYVKNESEKLFSVGDKPNQFYIIAEGEVDKIFQGIVREQLKKGDYFGDFDILKESDRTATIQTKGDCYFWVIDSHVYSQYADNLLVEEIRENRDVINGHYFFDIMTEEQKDELLHVTFTKQFRIGNYIGLPTEMATSFFIIKEGNVIVNDENGKQVNKLGPGDEFGFEEFYKQKNYKHQYVAYNSKVYCLKVDRISFERFLGEDFQKFFFKNIQRHSCENNHTIQNLEYIDIERIIRNSKFVKYKTGQHILNKGQIADKIFFIIDGQAKLVNTDEDYSNDDQDNIFDRESVIFEIKKEAPGNFIMNKEGTISEIEAQKFLELFGDQHILGDAILVPQNPHLQPFFKKVSESSEEDMVKESSPTLVRKILRQSTLKKQQSFEIRYHKSCDNLKGFGDYKSNQQNGALQSIQNQENMRHSLEQISQVKIKKFDISDFIHIRQIGKGYFGVTQLCYNKKDEQLYALKVIQKQDIVDKHMEVQVCEEKKILEILDHGFIMDYYGAFMDEHNVFFVLQCIDGIELFDAMRQKGVFSPEELLYYAASLVSILEYLHSEQIVYRDLKPENIMINAEGEVKLIDLGASTRLSEKGGRTYTMTGTPHYMAPEIVDGVGYSYFVDLWSLGIVLFECLCGPTPFETDYLDDPMEIYNAIKNNKLEFPDFVDNQDIKDLITQLLNKKPFKRLGASWSTLKQHPYFDIKGKFNWHQLQEFYGYRPPYQPPSTNMDELDVDEEIKNNVPLSKVVEKIKYSNEDCKYNKDWETEFQFDPDMTEEEGKENIKAI